MHEGMPRAYAIGGGGKRVVGRATSERDGAAPRKMVHMSSYRVGHYVLIHVAGDVL